MKNRDHLNDSIVEISQNAEKSSRDLRKFAVTPEKDAHLTLVRKPTRSKLIIIIIIIIITDHQIQTRRPDLVLMTKKKRTYHPLDFTVPADHKVKMKEEIDKHLDLAREMKKLCNLKVTVLIVFSALGRVRKNFLE